MSHSVDADTMELQCPSIFDKHVAAGRLGCNKKFAPVIFVLFIVPKTKSRQNTFLTAVMIRYAYSNVSSCPLKNIICSSISPDPIASRASSKCGCLYVPRDSCPKWPNMCELSSVGTEIIELHVLVFIQTRVSTPAFWFWWASPNWRPRCTCTVCTVGNPALALPQSASLSVIIALSADRLKKLRNKERTGILSPLLMTGRPERLSCSNFVARLP